MTHETSDVESRSSEYLALLGRHELDVAACVHALVPSWHDAEDIIQEVRLQLWREFGKFQPGSDFPAWARTIARYAVRRYVTQNQRKPLLLSSDVEDILMARLSETPRKRADQRLAMLAECVKKLGIEALDLLRRRYIEKQKVKDVAAELGRSLTGTYQALFRVRRELLGCMQKHLRREENP